MAYLNPRRKVSLLLFFWLFVFACAAYSINLHLQFIVLLIFLGVLIIVDFMFLSADTFVYDPVSEQPTTQQHHHHQHQQLSDPHLLHASTDCCCFVPCVVRGLALQVMGHQDGLLVLRRVQELSAPGVEAAACEDERLSLRHEDTRGAVSV